MQQTSTELDFIHAYLDRLSVKSVRYGQDYLTHTVPTLRIKRQPVVHKDSSPATTATTTTESSDKFQLNIKVLKPSFQFSIGGLQSNDTVSHLKQRIYQQQSAYPVNRQRLLVKGKVLGDQKTLGELGLEGDSVVHLMLTAAPASKTGRFGISAEAEQKMNSPEFWETIEKTLVDQLGQADATLVFSKVKAALTP
ncbi:hypothetical protein BCV71DRAFT_171353 [Rhizopus microsporus]|uniref:Ubiquitin-like domain-containing protein n=1 Tax=Rhizopus microsporus TaxID=58291 RepID=A0A1X0SEW6_RHIZD|nr:hypothetical protein BCV71DRAFT_171353 [Rhizopus microsporus]